MKTTANKGEQVVASHTPGPWTAEWTLRDQFRYFGWHVGQPDTDNTVCVIEDERGCDVEADRRKADARLIAAAPDMLKSLECVVAALTQNATFPADIALAVKVAKDAIAKATAE